MSTRISPVSEDLFHLDLERPVSVRKNLPEFSSGWLLNTYVAGRENDQLRYLFDPQTILDLGSISPVLFYGEKSLGKTALAITLSVRWSRVVNERPVIFLTGKDFCQQYAAAVEIDDVTSFRNRLRYAKMLVIDHLGPISDKVAAQQELCATLDCLLGQQRPIIVTCSGLPLTTTGISPQLASRLSSGFSVLLSKPEGVARSALIELLVSKINRSLPTTDLQRLADDLSADQPLCPAQLASLVQLADQNLKTDGKLDLFVLRSLVRQMMSDESPGLAFIAKSVCRRLRVKLSDARGVSRLANIVRARGLAILLSRRFTTFSLQQIGAYFGGRDHSTILHAIRKTSALLADDPELANLYRDIEADILSR